MSDKSIRLETQPSTGGKFPLGLAEEKMIFLSEEPVRRQHSIYSLAESPSFRPGHGRSCRGDPQLDGEVPGNPELMGKRGDLSVESGGQRIHPTFIPPLISNGMSFRNGPARVSAGYAPRNTSGTSVFRTLITWPMARFHDPILSADTPSTRNFFPQSFLGATP